MSLSSIHRNSWSASRFQRNQLNSIFESCVKSMSDFFTVWQHINWNLLNSSWHKCFFLFRNCPRCGYYGTWVNVVFVLSSSVKLGSVGIAMWSLRFVAGDIFCCMVCIYVCVKKTKRKLIYKLLKVLCNRYFIFFLSSNILSEVSQFKTTTDK